MERLVAGRERIYLDRSWNDFSAKPARFTEAEREHYAALYAAPGRMHAGFRQFAAFDQDAIDNRAWLATHGKLTMPVLAIGGDKSFGSTMALVARGGAVNVEERVIADAGHWLMEEQPAATVAAIRSFLDAHTHRDDRVATVISGTWYFGFGGDRSTARIKALTAGGWYTEPGQTPHFALTRDEPAVVRITGLGPSDTVITATEAGR